MISKVSDNWYDTIDELETTKLLLERTKKNSDESLCRLNDEYEEKLRKLSICDAVDQSKSLTLPQLKHI